MEVEAVVGDIGAGEARGFELRVDHGDSGVEVGEVDEEFLEGAAAGFHEGAVARDGDFEDPVFAEGGEDGICGEVEDFDGGADEAVGDVIGVAFMADEDIDIDACFGFDGFPFIFAEVGDDEVFDGFVYESVHGGVWWKWLEMRRKWASLGVWQPVKG